MRSKRSVGSRWASRGACAVLMVGVLVTLLWVTGGEALAKKPVKPPPPPPAASYEMADCGIDGWAATLNEWGDLVGGLTTAPGEAHVLFPEDTTGDGYPDTWSRDTAPADGVNDLVQGLGWLGVLEENEHSFGRGMNNHGLAVGFSGSEAGWIGHGFVWDGQTMRDVGTQYHPTVVSAAKGINDEGVVIGGLYRGNDTPTTITNPQHFVIAPIDVNGAQVWFLDDDGDGFNDLMQLLGIGFHAVDIDEQGRLAGQYYTDVSGYEGAAALLVPLDTDDDGHPDTWFQDDDADGVNDLVTFLPAPEGSHYVGAVAINENGWMVGSWRDSRNAKLAALWRPIAGGGYEFVDLGGVKSYSQASAQDINDHNVILGSGLNTKRDYRLPSGRWVYDYVHKAVLWVDGDQISLTDQVDTLGRELGGPRALNNRGEILLDTDGGPVVLVPNR